MEFINIPRWSAKDVVDWMKGVDAALQPYLDTIMNRKVTGDRLLLMSAQDLEELGIEKVGHQEIMLDAIHLLCNLHYRQSVEDLQSVTLNLNTRANCLTKFLHSRNRNGGTHAGGKNGTSVSSQSFPASILVLVAEIVTAAKTVISWLDRPPFVTGDHFFKIFREDILKLALELTQVVQQSGSLVKLEERLLELSQELGDFSDDLVKKASDPLIIQTSTIDFVTIKKHRSEEELGLEIRTSAIDGTHLIIQIKPNSAAGATDKIHIGDEILQVNYQTVVGWSHGKVIETLKCNVSDITFTLKKRPRHLTQPGQIQRPKANHFLLPNVGLNSLPYRRPSGSRRRVAVKDDMYLPSREATEKVQAEEEEEERPPDTPSEVSDSPLDSPSIEAPFIPPRGHGLGRRPTMVPGMGLSRRRGLPTRDRPRSLPADLDELRKELNKTLGKGSSSKPEKIKPLPKNMKFPTQKMNGKIWDTEPMPVTNDLFPQKDKTAAVEDGERTASEDPCSVVTSTPISKKTVMKGVSVTFKEDVATGDDVEEEEDGDHHSNKGEDADCCSNADEDGPQRVEKEAEAEGSEGQGSQGGEGIVNTNNNEDAQVPVELAELCSVVNDLENEDGFVVIDSPSERTSNLKAHPSNASEFSTMSSDTTDGVVRLRPHKAKPRIKMNRGVSCVDLGPGEWQGYLWKKNEKAIGPRWNKMWFVLKEFVLYYYKDKKATKAKGVICLPGFQIVPAPECNRSHAFRATHKGTIKDIYLAASDEKNLKYWMEKLQLATIMLQDEGSVRQSRIITETVLNRLDPSLLKETGYASESTDDDSRKGSFDIAQDSGDSSDTMSTSTASQSPSLAGTVTSTTIGSDAAAALASIKESSPDEFVEEWRKINNVAVKGLDRGTSFRGKKRDRPSLRIPKQKMSPKAEKTYEKNMLLRKLKAKQAELDSVERLLQQGALTPETLAEWREEHEDLLRCVHGRPRDTPSSDSDPESLTPDLPLSSSMSSINTNSTSASNQESAALCEDMTPVSDGTTSGCDVQTPLSDMSPPIGEAEDETLTATSNQQTELSPSDSPKRISTLNITINAEGGLEDQESPNDHCDDSAFTTSPVENSGNAPSGDGERQVSLRSESEASETSL